MRLERDDGKVIERRLSNGGEEVIVPQDQQVANKDDDNSWIGLDDVASDGLVHRKIPANGITLHYLMAGSGPTIVLLHGWGNTSIPGVMSCDTFVTATP
jgi:hypothetical protein